MNPQKPILRALLWAVAYVAVGIFVLGTVVIAINTYSTAHAIRHAQINNKSTFELLQNCVVPDMKNECYVRGQENQKNILTYVEYLNVAATACADVPGTQTPEELKACTERTLNKLGLPVGGQ